ncbi:MAG TPA: hypothetical protein VFA23_10445 [Dongiaceae bacterium]|nr:hypothetical protein [Dongiaceae bacterium]
MTAQSPERIILDGRPHQLFADPLYRLRKRCRLDLANPLSWSTGNYRGYVGTWEISDRRLYLVHLCWDGWDGSSCEVPISGELRQRLLRAASASGFPIHAHWFSGIVRIAIGRRLVYSHHGWSSWFERERVIRFVAGDVVRDREVDTRAILERWLRRHPEAADRLAPSNPDPLGPLTWFDEDDGDWEADWWPPDYIRRR